MKSQKGGRVAMPFEYFNAGVKGPFTSSALPTSRGKVDSGDLPGPLTGKRSRHSEYCRRKRKTILRIIMQVNIPSVQEQ